MRKNRRPLRTRILAMVLVDQPTFGRNSLRHHSLHARSAQSENRIQGWCQSHRLVRYLRDAGLDDYVSPGDQFRRRNLSMEQSESDMSDRFRSIHVGAVLLQ